MGWPDLSAYPAWINTLAGVVFALGIGLVTLAAFFGRLRGALTPPEERGNTAQLAMVTLDSSAIREHTKAVSIVGEQLNRMNDLGDRYLNELHEAELRAAEQRGREQGRAEPRPRAQRKPPDELNYRSTPTRP